MLKSSFESLATPHESDFFLEEELMHLPNNETIYLGPSPHPRVRAMSVPTRQDIKRRYNADTLQSLRKEVDNIFLAKLRRMDMRLTLVQHVVDTARTRPLRRPLMRSRQSVFAALFANLPTVERQAAAQFVDVEFVSSMKSISSMSSDVPPPDVAARVVDHFARIFLAPVAGSTLMRPLQHSLAMVLMEFARVFDALYGQPGQPPSSFMTDDDKLHLDRAAMDVWEFGELMVQVIQYKYPFLAPTCVVLVQEAVEDALFLHLQSTLHGLYAAVHRPVDDFLAAATARLRATASLLEICGIKARFRLDYTAAAAVFAALPSLRTPSAKISCVARTCQGIDQCIKVHYMAQDGVLVESLNVTADDLAPLLAYVVVMAGPAACRHLASHIALMDAFLPDRFAVGQEAFALAMLHAAVTHIQTIPQISLN
ncbi:Aste57867_25265 [Aphanomyces stellatus]|uniref:Aste57867_25265 protein n=1 Tax=Aphanomyces stellatus TaxID=120398 RepID=A0A485LSN5_9STRA|nr:hypothetical protein As57867_025187 [Aphanomyces stellatus]VFU01891.1 Aste57867_25265 [Aphanomyces stellatus]